MGASKLDIYTEEINELAAMAKVMAHPARLSIIKYISAQKDCICNDIVDEIGLSQPTISQHLKVIGEAGLLKGNFKGKSFCYCLDTERLIKFQKAINTFLDKTKFNCC